jgi:multidrug efflux system outer membrane protein
VLRIEEARGQYRVRRADRLPTLDATAGATRSRGEGFEGNAQTSSRFDIGAGISSFELDFWGRVRSLTEAARANYLSTIHARRSFQIGLVADVAEAYLTERELDARIALAETTVQSRTRALEIGRLRLDAGVTSALDYRQIETLLTQAQTQLANLQLERAQLRNTLEFLVGGPIPAPLPAPLPLAAQGHRRKHLAGAAVGAARQPPRHPRGGGAAARRQRRCRRRPRRLLPADQPHRRIGLASSALGSLFSGGAFTWTAGANAGVPIFDAGRNRGNLAVANARRGIATAGYERTIQNAFREVADRLAGGAGWPIGSTPSSARCGAARSRRARHPALPERRRQLPRGSRRPARAVRRRAAGGAHEARATHQRGGPVRRPRRRPRPVRPRRGPDGPIAGRAAQAVPTDI